MIRCKWLPAIALLGISPVALAGDSVANALRDAGALANCMKTLDTECTLKLTYTKLMESQGFEYSALRAQLNSAYEHIRVVQGKTERLELGTAGAPFTGDGRQYIFIPYQETMNFRGDKYSQTAYFIGVSEDAGASWKFVDGIGYSAKNIRTLIPSYGGAALPPRATDPPSELP